MTRVLSPFTYQLNLIAEQAAAAPASCSNEFAVALAGCGFLSWRNEVEHTRVVQPSFFSRQVGLVRANGAGSFSTFGTTLATAGTLGGAGVSAVSALASSTRTRLQTAATAGSSALIRTTQAHLMRPQVVSTVQLGGFFFHMRFAHVSITTNERTFAGLYGTVADIGNVGQDTLLNCLGVGVIGGQTYLSLIYNDGSGAATTTAIVGGSYPATQVVYDVFFFTGTDETKCEYLVYNSATGAMTNGTLTGNIPDAGVFLAPQIWINNNNQNLASILDIMSLYWDSFY